jgi:hypothetical protein
MMNESPYITHRDILLHGMYGTAYLLQEFILHQLNPYRYHSDIDQRNGGFDRRHQQIYEDLKRAGPKSAGFNEVAKIIESRSLQQAQSNREHLRCLLDMRPEDYPHEPGENQLQSYRNDVENHMRYHREYVALGYIDE